MKTLRTALLAFCPIAASAPMGCESTDAERPRARIGMTKDQVVVALGEPTEKTTAAKRSEHIWGPPEEWWDELEMGDAFETWSYEYPGEGTYSVYFLRGEQTVSHLSFAEEGIVY